MFHVVRFTLQTMTDQTFTRENLTRLTKEGYMAFYDSKAWKEHVKEVKGMILEAAKKGETKVMVCYPEGDTSMADDRRMMAKEFPGLDVTYYESADDIHYMKISWE